MLIYLQMIETPEDKHKFELLYEEYRRLMQNVAYRILHKREDAEDAVHMAFIKIAENMDKIEDVYSPRTKGYVLTITENKSIDIYRYNKKNSVVALQDWDADPSTEYPSDDVLASCILKLPDNYRTMILLKYYHGYSTKEVANMLEISDVNASKLDQRAKKRLEELYQKEVAVD